MRVSGGSGAVVGQVTSGHGCTVARSIAYAYLPVDALGQLGLGRCVRRAAVAVDLDPAEVAPHALYDPKGERIRA